MNRRSFLTMLGLAPIAAPLAVKAADEGRVFTVECGRKCLSGPVRINRASDGGSIVLISGSVIQYGDMPTVVLPASSVTWA